MALDHKDYLKSQSRLGKRSRPDQAPTDGQHTQQRPESKQPGVTDRPCEGEDGEDSEDSAPLVEGVDLAEM